MAQTHASPGGQARRLIEDNGRPSKAFDLKRSSWFQRQLKPSRKKMEDIGDDDKISDDTSFEDDEPVIVPKPSYQ